MIAVPGLAACLVTGCGNAATDVTPVSQTPTTTSVAQAVAQWRQEATADSNAIGDGIGQIEETLTADQPDFDAVKAACRGFQASTEKLAAHLPSPDPRLTAAVETAVASYLDAARTCLGANPDVQDPAWERVITSIEDGADHMAEAGDIMDAYG